MLRLVGCMTVVSLVAPVVGSAAPAGKVVRVERKRASLDDEVPVVCEVKSDPTGFCIGKQPAIGTRGVVVDDSHVVAELRVSKVSGLNAGCDMLWSVGFEVSTGDLGNVRANKAIAVVSNNPLLRDARRLDEDKVQSPSNNTNERVLVALDRDRDQRVDLFITAYQCDANGMAVAVGSPNGIDNCVDVWSHLGKQPKRMSHTKFAQCITP